MPAGTVFAPFVPCVLKDRLQIKVDGGSIATGWHGEVFWAYNGVMPLEPWNLSEMYQVGDQADAEFEIYDGDQNDLIDETMIAVLEPQDVEQLIRMLRWAQRGCPDDGTVR